MSDVMWTAELREWLEEEARAAGFDAVGVAAVQDVDDAAAVVEAQRFEAWVEAGHAGEMEYLKRRDDAGALLRSALQVAMPWAQSAVVCALNYNADAPRSMEQAEPGAGWIARYAWSGRTAEDGASVPTDYHDELLRRLRRIEAGLL
jgi:epoxyqueuosine reductase